VSRGFDEVKQELRVHFAALDNIERHRKNQILAVGNLLLEMQPIYCARYGIPQTGGRTPPGVLPFRQWAAREFGRSVDTIAEYMMIARSEKPERRLDLPKQVAQIGRSVLRALPDLPGADNSRAGKVERARQVVQYIAENGYKPSSVDDPLETAKRAIRALSRDQFFMLLDWLAEYQAQRGWERRRLAVNH
jgi:uncharacterized protein YyaL (SSP411 family)